MRLRTLLFMKEALVPILAAVDAGKVKGVAEFDAMAIGSVVAELIEERRAQELIDGLRKGEKS